MSKKKRDSFASARSVGGLAFWGQGSHQPRKESRHDHGRCAARDQVVFQGRRLESANAVGMLIRLVAAFTGHVGRMSAVQAAGWGRK
jgi:hypothetical protein